MLAKDSEAPAGLSPPVAFGGYMAPTVGPLKLEIQWSLIHSPVVPL